MSSRERMDCPDFSSEEVAATFRFIEPVNRWFGGRRPLLSFFRNESRAWEPLRTYRILDAGCGAGDIPAALVRWARCAGFHISVEAIDIHPYTIELARRTCRDYPEITVSRRDVFDLEGAQYDYVMASMFLHHFPTDEVAAVLGHLLSLCRRRVIINDLLRDPIAYIATWLFSLPASRVCRHDARLSVRRGFTIDDLRRVLLAGSLQRYELETHFFYRFLLILSKEAAS